MLYEKINSVLIKKQKYVNVLCGYDEQYCDEQYCDEQYCDEQYCDEQYLIVMVHIATNRLFRMLEVLTSTSFDISLIYIPTGQIVACISPLSIRATLHKHLSLHIK
jgi:hypothetical protein